MRGKKKTGRLLQQVLDTAEARRGIPRALETRKKISASLTGRSATWNLGNKHFLGRKHSEEAKRRMRVTTLIGNLYRKCGPDTAWVLGQAS